MKREETKQLLKIIEVAYPAYKPQDKSLTVDLWTAMLGDYDFNSVVIAVQAYIADDTSGFAPSIGQVNDYLQRLVQAQYPSEMEAYAMYRKALGRASHPKEEFDKLPEIIQKTVGDPDNIYYTGTNSKFNEDVVRANFIKSYRVVVEREKQMAKLPQKTRAKIEQTTKRLGGIAWE